MSICDIACVSGNDYAREQVRSERTGTRNMKDKEKKTKSKVRFSTLEKFSFTLAVVLAGAAFLNAGGAVLEAYLYR